MLLTPQCVSRKPGVVQHFTYLINVVIDFMCFNQCHETGICSIRKHLAHGVPCEVYV